MDTFVVRLWKPAGNLHGPRGLRRVRGIVEHVASGRSSAFRGLDELSALFLSDFEMAAELASEAGTDPLRDEFTDSEDQPQGREST